MHIEVLVVKKKKKKEREMDKKIKVLKRKREERIKCSMQVLYKPTKEQLFLFSSV